jgi:SAM-dependent methyltransferase
VNADTPTERELRLLGELRGKRVLDLGCGTGSAAITFAHEGAMVIALDGSDARLAHAAYPGVDEAALTRAFEGLRSQALEFEACSVDALAESARAVCRGSAGSDGGVEDPRADRLSGTGSATLPVEEKWPSGARRINVS